MSKSVAGTAAPSLVGFPLPSAEHRLAGLPEGGRGPYAGLGRPQDGGPGAFELQSLGQGNFAAPADRFLGVGDRLRGEPRQPLGQLGGPGVELLAWHRVADQADAQRRGRIDPFSGHDQPQGVAQSDDAGKALGPARAGNYGEADLGRSERGLLGGDADIAGRRDLQSSAQAVSMYGRDSRLPGLCQHVNPGGGVFDRAGLDAGAWYLEFTDVRSAAETFRPRPADKDHPDVSVFLRSQ